jgi:hypothetical protein
MDYSARSLARLGLQAGFDALTGRTHPMKCPALRVAVAALLLSGLPSAAAADTEWYAGLGMGLGWAQLYTADFNTSACTVPCTDSKQEFDAGFKGFIGYQFSRNWAFEVSWTSLGKFHYKVDNGTATQDAIYQVKGAGYSFVPRIPFTRNFSVFGRLGGFASQTRLTRHNDNFVVGDVSPSIQYNGYSLLAGFGAQYFINEESAIRIEVEDFGRVGSACATGVACTGRANARMVSASLVFPF